MREVESANCSGGYSRGGSAGSGDWWKDCGSRRGEEELQCHILVEGLAEGTDFSFLIISFKEKDCFFLILEASILKFTNPFFSWEQFLLSSLLGLINS